ncbi:hypothetical protein N7532_007740 [Penicillium argentinense]|uniref:Matrin-type domain-containing protein n=1 Tax=Penicillium argentinense TaxID=1131581 RepID=A0A9W9K1C3_9EURO|nr:uncharacterized protein N7532_007740 [Penicillium argentinense]KAJ5089056.1 hypothetical protein N7532_007740 [Penicillium argentinense]
MLSDHQRTGQEDLERLEVAIADRLLEDPRSVSLQERAFRKKGGVNKQWRPKVRRPLIRDHEVAGFLKNLEERSKYILEVYEDNHGDRAKELQSIKTGDPFEGFYNKLAEMKAYYKRYPTIRAENLERSYKRRQPEEGQRTRIGEEVDNMFTGEERYGWYLDLTTIHQDYLNLPGVKRLPYIQYLDVFDKLTPPDFPLQRKDKISDKYFNYVGNLAKYLEGFIKRAQPLKNLRKILAGIDDEFDKQWAANEVPGWTFERTGGTWCADCEKLFMNHNIYEHHFSGRKHIRAAKAKKAAGESGEKSSAPPANASPFGAQERAIAWREHRVRCLTKELQTVREATRTEAVRKRGLTERERQNEYDDLMAEPDYTEDVYDEPESDEDDKDDNKIYNPLKLPLQWDGSPIPFWLYKLHGLGVEFPCEICGNFVYMGRRAFDKHFSEGTHLYGLKCLGITSNTKLYNEITGIADAIQLRDKLEADRKKEKEDQDNVEQMEDSRGNVMPKRIYDDLRKQGII